MQSIPSKILAAAVTAAVLIPGLAVAQNALEEVVVTATKRDASLSDLSVAANVIRADAIGPGGAYKPFGTCIPKYLTCRSVINLVLPECLYAV